VIARIPLFATDDDVMRISSHNPGWRVERTADGVLTMTPPTGAASSNRNARLTHMFFEWAESHGYVAFDSNGGFRLPDTSVIGPDASLVTQESWERLTVKQRERFFPGAPTVAVELCSDSDNPNELRAKLERIRQAGASYVILIDPYRGEIWTDGIAPEGFDLDFEPLLA
jgi:Uma2 family endonuclease